MPIEDLHEIMNIDQHSFRLTESHRLLGGFGAITVVDDVVTALDDFPHSLHDLVGNRLGTLRFCFSRERGIFVFAKSSDAFAVEVDEVDRGWSSPAVAYARSYIVHARWMSSSK